MVFYELIIGAAVPATGVAVFIIKYFWHKEKCFMILKNKIKALDASKNQGLEEHNDFDERLTHIESRQQQNEIYLKLLLDKFEIKYH